MEKLNRLTVLDVASCDKVIDATLRILESTGCIVKHERGRQMLAEAGCTVEGELVKIPSSLVRDAIAKAQKDSELVLYDRDGNPGITFNPGESHIGPAITTVYIIDPKTRGKRRGMRSDAADVATLIDSLENISWASSIAGINDGYTALTDVYEIQELVKNTNKPIMYWASDPKHLESQRRILETAAGGGEAFVKKPFAICLVCPLDPLVHTEEGIEQLIYLAKHRMPVIYIAGASMGSTAPITIAGSMAVGLADTLVGLLVTQLVSPGTPFVAAKFSDNVNMKTVTASHTGPEFVTANMATADVFRRLRLPFCSNLGNSDAGAFDQVSALDLSAQIVSAVLSGGGMVFAAGAMESGNITTYASLMFCNEVAGYAKTLFEPVCVDDAELQLNSIDEVGPGGNFLAEEATMERYADKWASDVLVPRSYDEWARDGFADSSGALLTRAQEIIDAGPKHPLDAGKAAAVDAIVEELEAAQPGEPVVLTKEAAPVAVKQASESETAFAERTSRQNNTISEKYADIATAVKHGKKKQVVPLVEKAIAEGCDAEELLNEGLIAPLTEIGERFSTGEVFVPEMLVAARAMSAGMEYLKPYLAESGAEPIGSAVIGTVKGDMHDIGKNLVRMMIEGKGFDVVDLGVDVPAETFVDFVKEHDVDLVCCSALLTTTMPEMKTVIDALVREGLRERVRVMVGGAPVNQAFADEIGADAYTEDASAAGARAVELVAELRASGIGGGARQQNAHADIARDSSADIATATVHGHTPLDMSAWEKPVSRNMSVWVREMIKARKKKPLPVLSFPAIQILDCTVSELVASADLQATALRAIGKRVDSAAIVSFMDLSVEAEAFGSRIVVSDDEVPTVVGSVVSNEEDLAVLQQPVVGDGRTGACVEAIHEAALQVDDRPVLAGLIGPFSLTGRLMDVNEVMVQCLEEPALVKGVLNRAADFLVEYAQAFKTAGADGVVMAEPLAGLLPAELVGEFSSVYVKRVVDAVQDDSFIVVYHNCGSSVVKAADAIVATGAAAFHFGNAIEMADILPLMPVDALVMGNIDPAVEMRNGTPKSVRAATLSLMGKCGAYPNFVPSTGCDVPPMSPWDNIDAFFGAVEDFYKS